MALGADGVLLATGSRDGTVKVWEVASGRQIASMSEDVFISEVTFSPEGDRVAFGTVDGTLGIWEYASSEPRVLATVVGSVGGITFNTDGRRLISGNADRCAAGVGRRARRRDCDVWSRRIDCRCRFPRQRACCRKHGPTYSCVDTTTGGKRQFVGHRDQLRSVSFTDDGRTLVSASEDETIKLWRLTGV